MTELHKSLTLYLPSFKNDISGMMALNRIYFWTLWLLTLFVYRQLTS
jgi:hypothetical protein